MDAAHPPAESTCRRFVLGISAGAALPLGPRARLHLQGGVGLGSRTTTGDAAFALGPTEAVEVSWLTRGPAGPTLGVRVSSHQSWTLAGDLDVSASGAVVVGLRFPGG